MQKFIFVDNKEELGLAWQEAFKDVPNVECHGKVDIFDFAGDAVVSPSNSFGFLDGGIDLIYTLNMGRQLQVRLQHAIETQHNGELLVGQYVIIPTGHVKFPNLLACPTMRVPKRLNNTTNLYLASKALFLAARAHPEFETIVCPGLGTGTGGISASDCARIMRMAYNDWYCENSEGSEMPKTLEEAWLRNAEQTND